MVGRLPLRLCTCVYAHTCIDRHCIVQLASISLTVEYIRIKTEQIHLKTWFDEGNFNSTGLIQNYKYFPKHLNCPMYEYNYFCIFAILNLQHFISIGFRRILTANLELLNNNKVCRFALWSFFFSKMWFLVKLHNLYFVFYAKRTSFPVITGNLKKCWFRLIIYMMNITENNKILFNLFECCVPTKCPRGKIILNSFRNSPFTHNFQHTNRFNLLLLLFLFYYFQNITWDIFSIASNPPKIHDHYVKQS